mgnify:CR=1 FL=1
MPIDLNAYEERFDARLFDVEPVSKFAKQLSDSSSELPSQFDLKDGISCAEAEVLALFYNPDLRIARLEAGVALATRETAGLWEDPIFGFDGARVFSPNLILEYGFMFGLTIPISGRLEVEKDLASAAYEAELHTIADLEWRTRAKVRRQWSIWTAAQAQSELLAETLEELERIDVIADHLESSGELNRVQRRLFRIQVADMYVQVSAVDLELIESEIALLELIGLPTEALIFMTPGFPKLTPPRVNDVTARLIDSNTTLAIYFARYQTAEDSLRLEITKQFPDIVIGSGYGTQFNDQRVMFGLSVPLPILNANRAPIARAHAQREVARAKAETTFSELTQQLSAAEYSLNLKRQQRDRYAEEIIPLLAAQAQDIQRIASLGELDMFVLLETVNKTLQTKQQLIRLRVEELDAAITVVQILGPNHQFDHNTTDRHTVAPGDNP